MLLVIDLKSPLTNEPLVFAIGAVSFSSLVEFCLTTKVVKFKEVPYLFDMIVTRFSVES